MALSEITLAASPERPSKLRRSPDARYSLILAALQFSQWAACSTVMAMSRMKISNSIAGLRSKPEVESRTAGGSSHKGVPRFHAALVLEGMYHSGDTSPFKGRESGTFNIWSLFPAPGQGGNAVTGNERKSGGLGGALDSLRLLGDALDLVQAGDDAAAQDVRSLGGHLGQNVLQLAGVGDVLLVGGLDQIGLLDQVVFNLGGRGGWRSAETGTAPSADGRFRSGAWRRSGDPG